MVARLSPDERLFASGWTAEQRVLVTSGCWHWTKTRAKGRTYGGGFGPTYGVVKHPDTGKIVGAHRFAYELAYGLRPPKGLLVMHSCDEPSCVRPSHLSLGTAAQNAADASAKGRLGLGLRRRSSSPSSSPVCTHPDAPSDLREQEL